MTTDSTRLQPTIGVGTIILDGHGSVLLIRRDKAPARGQWSIPGGCQEPGETLVETAAREVKEETGIDVTVGPIVAVAERINEGFHYVIIDFLATALNPLSAIPMPATDVSEAVWVKLSDLDDYDLVEGLSKIIIRVEQLSSRQSNVGLSATDNRQSDFLPIR